MARISLILRQAQDDNGGVAAYTGSRELLWVIAGESDLNLVARGGSSWMRDVRPFTTNGSSFSGDVIDRVVGHAAIDAVPRAAVRIGSEEHKELFCGTFIKSHREYEPRELPWPELDDASLARLRAIPIWSIALQVELNAGQMVTDFSRTLRDPLIRAAVALQGAEESRHARMVATLVERYGLSATTHPPDLPPTEGAFVHFGYRECLDSFFGFGIFRLAREARFLPDALVAQFTRVLAEEARHIVFFINWIAYERVRRGYGFPLLRAVATARGYAGAFIELIRSGDEVKDGSGFFSDGDAFADLTMAKFLDAALSENEAQMAPLDARLLRPRVLPVLAAVARRAMVTSERIAAAVRGNGRA